jgi:hypothetical protein
MKLIRNAGIRSIAKYQLIQLFNTRFYNREFYQKHTQNRMYLDYESNREIVDFLFQDVLQFSLQTDVYKTLGLSVKDLMSMDLASYTLVKEAVNKSLEEKAKAAEKLRADANKQNNNWTGGWRNGRR